MATNKDSATNPQPASHAAFPVDRPIEALTRDHKLVRRLADAYMNDTSIVARNQAAEQLLQAVEMHSRLEETVFYPAVREVDAGSIGHFEDEHHRNDDMLAAVRGMDDDDPRREVVLRELIASTLKHIQEEEEQFFPKLERSGMDLTPVGLQMQAFEANLVHMAAQAGDQGARR